MDICILSFNASDMISYNPAFTMRKAYKSNTRKTMGWSDPRIGFIVRSRYQCGDRENRKPRIFLISSDMLHGGGNIEY